MKTLTADQLERFTQTVFLAAGASQEESGIVARHLVEASLCGHDSHGVLRIPQYLEDIEQKRILPGSKLNIVREWNEGAVLDGRNMFGQVAGHQAAELAITKARRSSMSIVTVNRMNHSGRLGTYVTLATQAGMVGLAMANAGGAGQWVAPFGGRERRLSTNPFAFAAPTDHPFPLLVDISTCVAPEGKVRDYRLRGQQVPAGWIMDAEGQTTTDPAELYETPGGALQPLGGSAGHKGFALAAMVDVLAGALSMAGCPRANAEQSGTGSGLFLLVVEVDRFRPLNGFQAELSSMIEYLTSSQPAAGFEEVIVPGEYEFRQRQRRLDTGIPLPDTVWESLAKAADSLQVALPEVSESSA